MRPHHVLLTTRKLSYIPNKSILFRSIFCIAHISLFLILKKYTLNFGESASSGTGIIISTLLAVDLFLN
jgi:phosphatidylglycerophosphate synthase